MATVLAVPQGASEVDLTSEDEDRLLALARLCVAAAARGDLALARDAATERLGGKPAVKRRRGAAFVTLLEDGELRGCIGVLDPSKPLAEAVAGAAVGAVLHDWRFRPVTDDELARIDIHVSVLGPMVQLDDPTAFSVGLDGLLVERGPDRGLLLPEVALEHGFDTEGMLRATCSKAGLAADAWRDPGTAIYAFRTRRFGGPAVPER